jgi:hypothetical protein
VKIFKNESQQYLGSINALYISTLEDMMSAIKKLLGKSINYQYAIFNYKGMQLCDDSDISTLKAGDYLFIVKNDNTFHEKNYMLPYKLEKVLGEVRLLIREALEAYI